MANYTAVAAGGDWNVSTTWSPAGVPGALDTAILNSASGNVTVPAAGSTCATLTINGYLGTLLLNGNLTIATSGLNLGSFTGTINFNAGDIILPDGLFNLGNASVYTTLGTGGVRITKPSASFSIFNTNNKIWNCKFALAATGSTSPTIYFEDNPLEVTGLVSFQATTTGTYNLISGDIFTPNLVFLKMSGDFTISGSTIYTTTTGGQNIGFTGSANQTLTASGTHQLRCPLIINKTGGVLTLSGTLNYNTGTLTYVASGGTVNAGSSTLNISASTTLNTGGMSWNNVTMAANQTLLSNLNVLGNLTTQTTSVVFSGAFNINLGGNLIINITTSGANTPIVINGTGNQSWTTAGWWIENNITISKTSGTLTIGSVSLPNVYYRVGTLTYNNLGGVVDTSSTSSILNIGGATCTLNTNGINWYNISNIATSTITLTSNLAWSNNWSVTAGTISYSNVGNLSPASTANVNFSGSSIINLKNNIQITNATYNATTINTNTISVSGNLTISGSTSGTTTTNINGSGSQNWTSTAYLSAPLTIAKTVGSTLLLSANTYYGTGTLTYVSGTIDSTTNANTLNLTGSPSLNTLGMTWNKVAFSNVTITLLSDFTATGLVTITTGNPLVASINGVGRKFYANGGMTVNSTTSGNSKLTGTAELRFEGIGYWTAVATGNFCTWYQIDTVINPTGNFFIDTRFISNKITYSNSNGGTITSANLWIGTDNSGNSVSLGGMTLDTNDLIWNSITYFIHWNAGGATSTLTSLSNINCKYWIFYNVGTGTGINVNYSFPSGGNISNTETFYVANRTIVNLPTNANFETDNLYFSNGGAAITGNTQLNNGTIVVKRVLEKQDAFNSSFGTTLIKFANNSSWSNLNGGISFVMEILGNVTFNGNSYSQATLKYTGNINSPIAKGTLNITANCALTNMHKLTFNNLVITSGTTMTMNEFFSGLPNKNSIVGASSTSNFNVTFTDNFEKIAKFINVNGVTFTRPQQLLLLTNQPKKSRNIGIRYNNDLPNGIPKGDPSVQNLQTVGQSRTLLLGDPAFVKSI